jgi:hypothetical protein
MEADRLVLVQTYERRSATSVSFGWLHPNQASRTTKTSRARVHEGLALMDAGAEIHRGAGASRLGGGTAPDPRPVLAQQYGPVAVDQPDGPQKRLSGLSLSFSRWRPP